MDELFEIQLGIMRDEGMVKADTVIIDSSMVEVDRPRNTKEEDEAIKEGKVPEEWKKETNRKKKAQKDMDARATFKHGRSYFGYKNHLAIDAESKVIVSSKTTPASVHDSQVCKDLIDKEAKQVYGDSAYVGEPIAKELKEKCGNGVILHMNNRAYRNRALTAEEKETNRECSRIRARLEHIFGWMKMLFKNTQVQSIGLK
jgi:IS5 family transposase